MNWKKNLLGYVAIALVFTMIGFGVSTNFPAKAENGLTAAANTNTTVVTSPFTDAVSKVQSSVVGVSNYQTVRYSNNGNYGFSWGRGWGYGSGNNGNNDTTEQEVKAATRFRRGHRRTYCADQLSRGGGCFQADYYHR